MRAADPVPLHREHAVGPVLEVVHLVEQRIGVVGDPEVPLRQDLRLDLGPAALAAAVDDLLVGEHRLVVRAPLDRRLLAVGETLLVEAEEEPLRPAVVGRIGGGDLAAPVDRPAHPVHLLPDVDDVALGDDARMAAFLDRGILCREPECVVAHRTQHLHPLAPAQMGDHVPDRVIERVPHVEIAGRVRQHLDDVRLAADRCARAPPDRGSGPGTTARRPRPAAISPRSLVGRSAPSSPSFVSGYKKASRRRGSGEVVAADAALSLGHVRSRNIHLIVPPLLPPFHSFRCRSVRWRDDTDEEGEPEDAARLDAPAPRRSRPRRLRRGSVQRQQHGADPGDHGGGARDLLAGDHPGVARRPLVYERPLPLASDAGRRRAVSGDPGRTPSRPWQRARDLHLGDRPRLHKRDDGRLARGGRQDPRLVRLQRRGDEGGRRLRACARCDGRGRDRDARRCRGRPWLRRGAPDRSGRGRRVRPGDGCRCSGRRLRHVTRRLQVRAGADRRRAEDGPDRGDPPAPAGHAPRHARVVERAAGARRAGQSVRGRAQARLGRPGEGDPARDSPRRAEDQRRHRLPARGDRRDPQGVRRVAREVRSARLPQAGARRDAGADCDPDARFRAGRPCRRLRAALARRDAGELRTHPPWRRKRWGPAGDDRSLPRLGRRRRRHARARGHTDAPSSRSASGRRSSSTARRPSVGRHATFARLSARTATSPTAPRRSPTLPCCGCCVARGSGSTSRRPASWRSHAVPVSRGKRSSSTATTRTRPSSARRPARGQPSYSTHPTKQPWPLRRASGASSSASRSVSTPTRTRRSARATTARSSGSHQRRRTH